MLLKVKHISILLAVHNGAHFLDLAIESVCSQSFKDWELIIVENASTDQSFEIAKKWEKKDGRVKVYRNTQKGKNLAYNRAFSESKGDLICFFSADDILHKDNLKLRSEPFLNSSFSFTTCLLKIISKNKKFDGVVMPKKKNRPNFSGGSIMFTRSFAKNIFPIPDSLPNEDLWTSLYLKYFGSGHHISLPLYFYRIHENNSYGYSQTFDEKRSSFLARMRAFTLFGNYYFSNLTHSQKIFFRNFEIGLSCVKSFSLFKIIFLRLPFSNKLIFIFYCSPFLFWLKNRFFSLFSGKLDLI